MDHRQLHAETLVIDAHHDSIVGHIRRGNLSLVTGTSSSDETFWGVVAFTRGKHPDLGKRPPQINIPKMRQGGIDAAFFAVDCTAARHNHLAYALDGLGFLLNDLTASAADVVIVKRSEDIRQAKRDGKPAALLAVENADCTEKSLSVLRCLHEVGVRSIGLTHHVSSCAADGCKEPRDGVGLTQFGVRLVREMNRLGMLVDLAHISPSGFYHALEVSTKPVAFSHGNARALCDHPRNLTDDQLRALAQHGGFIGVSYVPAFVHPERPTLERLIAHIDHIVGVAGIDSVALGSDFDGGGDVLGDATEVPQITEELGKRGYAEADIRKILGGNTLRVLQQTIG